MKYVISLEGSPNYPWQAGTQLLYAGEIENNKGHGVYFLGTTMFHGYHTDSFFEYSDTHYGIDGHSSEFCLSDFLERCVNFHDSKSLKLPDSLLALLIELNKSHSPEDAEKSFVQQAIKMVHGG